ncbi:YheC/YheD family protein [Kroppenstedtia eburnea]|uniref:YheC/YheD family protein n=1 Tax=Kroppenstedtia eburnea TaxID=714067 RepID=UPI00362C6909
MIGVFMNKRPLNSMIRGNTSYEKLEFYRHFVDTFKEPLCFYSLDNIDPYRASIDGYVLLPGKNLTQAEVRVPEHHFSRAIIYRQRNLNKIKKFIRNHRTRFYQFQSKKERNKWTNYELLNNVPEIKSHLPETYPLTWDNVIKILERYKQAIVKPIYGSLGKKVVLIEKRGQIYTIKEKNEFRLVHSEVALEHLEMYYLSKFKRPKRFIVQQKVNTDRFRHRIYECRVSVQKTSSGEWEVTGWAVRLAQKGDYLTNVSQGSEIIPFSRIFNPKSDTAYTIRDVTTRIAKQFEKHFPDTIDLGIDLMLDNNKHVWFIEANLRDQRLSYYNDREMWRRTTITPLVFIQNQMVSESVTKDG